MKPPEVKNDNDDEYKGLPDWMTGNVDEDDRCIMTEDEWAEQLYWDGLEG